MTGFDYTSVLFSPESNEGLLIYETSRWDVNLHAIVVNRSRHELPNDARQKVKMLWQKVPTADPKAKKPALDVDDGGFIASELLDNTSYKVGLHPMQQDYHRAVIALFKGVAEAIHAEAKARKQ